MKTTLDFEKIAVGTEIPMLVKHPSSQQLVMWAGASGDYNPIHYDNVFAVSRGLPGVVVHGQLSTAFLCQMLSDWYGKRSYLKKIKVSYKGMNYPGDTLTCRGVIRDKSADGEKTLTVDIWVENEKGEQTVTGTAIIGITQTG
jgi:acyl dehydratase